MNATLIRTTCPARRRARRQGFSLAELMVVIVILGLLATIVVPNVIGYLFKANIAVAKSDITQIEGAVDSYALENGGKLPESLEVLIQPDENGKTYLKNYTSVPRDPWKNEYVLVPPDGQGDYMIVSYGKDGIPGGEGDDADITSRSIRERR
jgi:general secretion pathway protein G